MKVIAGRQFHMPALREGGKTKLVAHILFGYFKLKNPGLKEQKYDGFL